MERESGMTQDELTTEVVIDGVKLIVIARKIENEGWQLSVQNEFGINTNWLDYFPTAQIAIDTGLDTIKSEGIDDLIATDGFEYLLE